MNRGMWFFALMFVAVLAIASVSAIPQEISVHGRLTDNNSLAITTAVDINFTIYDAYVGGSALYLKSVNVEPDSNGVYNIILDNVDLDFSQQYYLGVKVGTDDEMEPRINLTSSPYAYRAQNVSSSGIIYDGNVDMGAYNLTTNGNGFFSSLGSLTSIITKLWVSEINATGNIGIGGNLTVGNYYTSVYQLSVQSLTDSSWIEILNNGGAGKGSFFGMYGDVFKFYNYQAGPIEFYTNTTNSTGELRMTIENSGDVIVAENLDVGSALKTDIINSSSSGNVTITSVGGSVIVRLG